jgi:hypothetical protein
MTHPAAALGPREKNLLFLTCPALWPFWPFLPLTRRGPGGREDLGVLFDALHAVNLTGHSATVFLTNLFTLPENLDEFLAMPKQIFDTPEELYAAGWRVD